MFLSKGYVQLRVSLAKAICNNVLKPHMFSSVVATDSVQPSIEKQGVPDKLYKEIQMELRGNDPKVLQSYGYFLYMAAKNLGICIARNLAAKKPVHERETVLKSVHIYKKHRVQYETRTYFRYIDIQRLTGSTADTYLEYIQRNLPEGVALKVTKVEIQRIPDYISPPKV